MLHLAQLMQNRGQIWATDRAGWRLQRLRRRAGRAGVSNYQASVWSGTAAPKIPWPCDGVLLDAPCTGMGTWQRNPHARWTTRIEDVRELAEIQWKLLQLGAARVKPGGRLVYSVCTLSRSETEGVADRADRELAGFEPLGLRNPLADGAEAPRVRLRPWAEGGNGMFVAAWRRR
jgi:16S rRNA (cytosine967-C5)-methyltransferase